MSVKPMCVFCGQELLEFGAILLSPPNKEGLVEKWHICTLCYRNRIVALRFLIGAVKEVVTDAEHNHRHETECEHT